MTRFYNSYDQVYDVRSRKSGEAVQVDLHLSFEKDTRFEEIIGLKEQMQEEFDRRIGNCTVSIVVENNKTRK